MAADHGGGFPGALVILKPFPLDKVFGAIVTFPDSDDTLDFCEVLQGLFLTFPIQQPLLALLRGDFITPKLQIKLVLDDPFVVILEASEPAVSGDSLGGLPGIVKMGFPLPLDVVFKVVPGGVGREFYALFGAVTEDFLDVRRVVFGIGGPVVRSHFILGFLFPFAFLISTD
jgi:hypothetical protein